MGELSMHEEAVKCFDKALAIDPEYAKALAGKASALAYLGKPEDAKKCFHEALALNPDEARIREAMALLREQGYLPE